MTDAGGPDGTSPRGYTGHEMMDGLGLVHMNGRVYDPLLSRFLSADCIIQATGNLQSYNRYTYVFNRPLSMFDPDGNQAVEVTAGTLIIVGDGVGAGAAVTTAAVPVAAVGLAGLTVEGGMRMERVVPGFSSGQGMFWGFSVASRQIWTSNSNQSNVTAEGAKAASQQASQQAQSQSTAPKPAVEKEKAKESTSGGQMDPEKPPSEKDSKNKERMAEVRAKGQEGETQQQAKIAADGETTTGTQVTFETSKGTRTRIDATTTDGQKQIVREAKNGENARLSPGQKDLKADAEQGNQVIPRGENARKAGYAPDQPTILDEFKEDRF